MILGPHIDRVTFRNPDNTIFEIHTVAIGSDAKKYAQQWIERNRRPGPSTWSYSIERNGEQTGATMANRTTVELKKANIAAMGEGLGAIFSELWQSFAVAHLFWNEYVILFGTKPERIQHLNRSAPGFFRMLQDEFWESALLHLARLTDPTNSQGKQGKANLTIRALPGLITDATLKDSVNKLLAGALKQTEFCRDWRNRHIAHRDLRLALEQPTTPLTEGSRAQVKTALKAIADVLNVVEKHFFSTETRFDLVNRSGGAISLLYVLDMGLRAQDLQQKRLEKGEPLDDDLTSREL